MELWIRSQDREAMLCVHAVAIAKDKVNSILGCGIDRNMKLELGTYKSKERALEVLNEIQKIIGWLQQDMKYVTIGDCKNLKGNFDNYVYEMPKE